MGRGPSVIDRATGGVRSEHVVKQMTTQSGRRWLWPLRSRKVQVALATIVAAWASQAGIMLNEESVATVLGVGIALILGIAHEDAGRSQSGPAGDGCAARSTSVASLRKDRPDADGT